MKFVYNDGGRSNYFKGNAKDCVVRALSILLNEDYKKIYDFSFTRVGTPRNGVVNIGDIYLKKGLVYEPIHGYAGDYSLDEIDFNFIAQYDRHVHAVIDKTINDTHNKYDLDWMEGIWVEEQNREEVLKLLYPNDYLEYMC
jgi:hypothetical protein